MNAIISSLCRNKGKQKTRLKIARVWLGLRQGQTPTSEKIGCLKMSNVYGHPKLARWPQNGAFWDQLQTKKNKIHKVAVGI